MPLNRSKSDRIIIRKTEGREVAYPAIERLASGIQFCAVDRQTVETSLRLRLNSCKGRITF